MLFAVDTLLLYTSICLSMEEMFLNKETFCHEGSCNEVQRQLRIIVLHKSFETSDSTLVPNFDLNVSTTMLSSSLLTPKKTTAFWSKCFVFETKFWASIEPKV